MEENSAELAVDPKLLNELQYILTDIIAGDDNSLARPEYRTLSAPIIQTALNHLLKNPMLDDKQKAYLISNSWRVNYRDKPPTIDEFITEKYLGRAALHTYDRVKQIFREFMDPMRPYRNLVLYPHIGFGKASRLSARVYTPSGFKLMKDVQAGDIVSTPSGSVAQVLQTFDQPVSMLYKVTFSDGRSTVVHGDHLWKAARSWHGEKPCWKVISTKDILATGSLKKQRWFIPLTEPVLHEERKHIIPPYTLGVLLGDGSLGSNAISFCGNDKEIFDRVESELPEELFLRHAKYAENSSTTYSATIQPLVAYSKQNSYKAELKRLGLKDKYAWEKTIPDEYLYDSVENRIALLQGLMDTDGSASLDGYASFSTTSLEMAKQILQLTQSLGGYGRVREDWEDKEGSTRSGYGVSISFPDRSFPIFYISRKQMRCIESASKPKSRYKRKHLIIAAIEEFAEEASKCIMLDDKEHLYLTDEYIVTHNSYLSTLINIYTGVHLSMMRNPYKFFGLNPATILSQLLVSYSLKKSSELLLEPLIAILEASPFFEKVHTRDSMVKKDLDYERQSKVDKIYWTTAVPTSAIQFSNGANFKMVSNIQNLLGLSVVTGTMSELAFFREAGKSDEYIMRMFNDLKSRIDSRMKGNYFGRSILDSSPNTLDSPIDDYVVNHSRKDPTNYVVDGSLWKWAPKDYDMTKIFRVFTGGKGQPPRIVETEEEAALLSPNQLIEVPLTEKQFFVDDLYKSLKDRAGIPAGSADALIYDYSKIEAVFDTRLRNIYSHINASSEDPPARLIWNQISHLFFRQKAGRTEFWYKPHLPRCVAIDQSISEDVSCIAVAHVERIAGSDEQMYVVDFVVPIAPAGSRINLDAIKMFVEELHTLGGMYISHISYDQFQSESSIQYLKARGFEVEKLSVDLTTDPYFHLLSLIDTKRIVTGRNLYVKNNLKSLKIVRKGKTQKPTVDHEDSRPVITTGTEDWNKSMRGAFAKDATDSIAAACELLRRYHPVAFDAWDPSYLDRMKDDSAEQQAAKETMVAFMSKIGAQIN